MRVGYSTKYIYIYIYYCELLILLSHFCNNMECYGWCLFTIVIATKMLLKGAYCQFHAAVKPYNDYLQNKNYRGKHA